MTTKSLRLGAVAFFLTCAIVASAAIPPAENLLPADTLAFFTVPDCNAFRAASRSSPQAMFWNDPAMRPFHDQFMARFNERFVAPLENDLGLKVADFLALPQGQVTLAVTVNGSNGHDDVPPGLLLLLDAKDKSALLKTNLATLTKKWTAAGRAIRTEKIHGLAFTVVPLTSNDFSGILPQPAPVSEIGRPAPKPAAPGQIYFTQFGSLLVAGNSARAVDAVAAHLTGSAMPAIADDPTFAADKLSQFRDAPTYCGWFNATKFFSLMTPGGNDDPEDPMQSASLFSAAKILGPTGLDGLKSASFAMRETPAGSSVTLHLTAPEATRAGLLKILALSPKEAGIPAFVPADAIKFSRFRLDGRQTWAELQKMVAAVSPQYLASLNSVIDMANTLAQTKDPGFDLRTSLFGNLGDDIVIYGKAPAGDALADLASPPSITLIAVSNPEQVINSIKNLLSLTAPQAPATKPREMLGHKIYTIALRPKPAADGSATPANNLYLSSAGGYVAISKNDGILEEYLRSADGKVKPLRDTPGIADAASHVGGTGGGLFTYENQREAMRTTFKLLKNSMGGDTIMRLFPPAFRDWADFSLLPDYGTVSKYFYLSVMGGHAGPEGITLKVFTPRPPQLH
jgi:hypothetical protein